MELTGEVKVERPQEGLAIVALEGEHDLGTVPDVRAAIGTVVDRGDALLIDLGSTSFVDSSILGLILEARRGAAEAGRGFAVAYGGASEAVRRVLEVTGLREELPVHATRAEAIESLGSGESP